MLSSNSLPVPLPFSYIFPNGDLARRANLNFNRLEETKYQPDHVFQPEKETWPGDTEGRTVLALTLLARALHREPKYLAEIYRRFPSHFNANGYFGKISLPEIIDEQQLSSHGWVLRGLCEEYLRTKSAEIKRMLDKIVEQLVLPTRRLHRVYPIDPAKRVFTGQHSGMQTNQIGRWHLSSDIGCDYIFLDGVVQAWEVLGTATLRELIDEIISRFLEVDLVAIKAQTHATLTGLRAVLRYARATSRFQLLDEVEKRFRLYCGQGITENFANYNWFQRPEWTEPCAVVDSFILAVDLWQVTAKPEYLEMAHLIYFNGLGHGQRANGGFGCDTCAGARDAFLGISVVESHWCCTMRGGEGLARAVQYLCFQTPEAVYFPFLHDSELRVPRRNGLLHLKQTTRYPYEGIVHFEVLPDSVPQNVTFLFYLWPTSLNPRLVINGVGQSIQISSGFVKWSGSLKTGDVLTYNFDLTLRSAPLMNFNSVAGYQTFRHGPLLLACEGSSAVTVKLPVKVSPDARYQVEGFPLAPLNDLIDRPELTKENYTRQVLFPKG